MIKAKRYHPMTMVMDLWTFIKNSFIFALYLFVLKMNSQENFITYGRLIFLVVVVITIVTIILKWFTQKYELDEQAFHLYKGIFSKSERTIPFSKVQNVNRHTSFFHRLFKLTSIHFETAIAGEDATVTFEVISVKEANEIENFVANASKQVEKMSAEDKETNDCDLTDETVQEVNEQRTIHFQPTKQDILKASFTSFSFLLLIPLLGSVYFKIDDIFHVEEEAKGIVAQLMSSSLIFAFLIFVLLTISIIFGITRTFLKYGNYEISSDANRIYISKGMIDETAFSIKKDRVQAIVISQSFLKRMLGLAEVKLISAGNLEIEDEKLEVSVLYPFLPVKKAYEMITEILPSYEVTEKMNRLPKKSFWVRLLQPSWLWIVATVLLFYFQPPVFNIKQAWWMISVLLLMLIVVFRVLDYSQTRYTMNKEFIQFKKGSLTTSLFLSKREKIIEVSVSRNIFQRMFGLASIRTINRAKPVHHAGVADIPIELADDFYKWYIDRRNEIEVERD